MKIMDDFEFESETFMEFLEPSFGLLFSLLKEVNECDTKVLLFNIIFFYKVTINIISYFQMNILYIMSFIVEKMSANIQSQANNLINYLPLLWEESKDHNMLRCAIISTLVSFKILQR